MKCSELCPQWNKGVGTKECIDCEDPATKTEYYEQVEKLERIKAILDELPNNTTPSSRYLKELLLPKFNRLRELVK